ncbi:hypothetical protein [Rubritalea tangerina]
MPTTSFSSHHLTRNASVFIDNFESLLPSSHSSSIAKTPNHFRHYEISS